MDEEELRRESRRIFSKLRELGFEEGKGVRLLVDMVLDAAQEGMSFLYLAAGEDFPREKVTELWSGLLLQVVIDAIQGMQEVLNRPSFFMKCMMKCMNEVKVPSPEDPIKSKVSK